MTRLLTAAWFRQIAEQYFDLRYTEKALAKELKRLNKAWRPNDDSETEGNKTTRLKKCLIERGVPKGTPLPRPAQQQRPNMWLESDGCKVLYRVQMTGVLAGSNALGPGGESAFREWEDNMRFMEAEKLNGCE